MSTQQTTDWKQGDPVGYIRSEIPDFQTPPYDGDRYDAMVPDTFDLQERARLVIHAMTEATDPLADYEPYYLVYFRTNPPSMRHATWQGATLPKYMESVALMRLVSGSDQNLQVDRRWMEVALKSQGPDGLIYTPTRGRPWGNLGGHGSSFGDAPEVAESTLKGKSSEESDQVISAFGNGRMLSTMALFAERDRGPLWRDATRRLADGLIALAVHRGEIAYFWPNVQFSTKEHPRNGEIPAHAQNFDGVSRVTHGLVHAYRLLGYEPCLDLARKTLTRWRSMPRFVSNEIIPW